MLFPLAFEADHGFAMITLDLCDLKVWCAGPFVTVFLMTKYHQRVLLISVIINEPIIFVDDFRKISEDNFKLLEISRHLALSVRAFEILNFLLIDIMLEGLLDAPGAVSVSALLEAVATSLNQVIQAYLASWLLYREFLE